MKNERLVCCEKHLATEVDTDSLGNEWKGYVVLISGRNDKQGFPIKEGVQIHSRVHLLLNKRLRIIDQRELERGKICLQVYRGCQWFL